jgi:hypothetical protein
MDEQEIERLLDRMRVMSEAMWPLVPRPLGNIPNPLLAMNSCAAQMVLALREQNKRIAELEWLLSRPPEHAALDEYYQVQDDYKGAA